MVNGHKSAAHIDSLMATLVRRALAEVYTVPIASSFFIQNVFVS